MAIVLLFFLFFFGLVAFWGLGIAGDHIGKNHAVVLRDFYEGKPHPTVIARFLHAIEIGPNHQPLNKDGLLFGYLDDGQHHDGNASDNIWGNSILTTALSEDSYTVDLFTYDSIFDVQFDYHPSIRFITFGPVSISDYYFRGNDTEPNPGDYLRLELILENNGSEATATNIEATLIPVDPRISFSGNTRSFEDILPGESSIPKSPYSISISEDCPANTEIPIQVNISSYDHICWIDTFYIEVVP
ncbi:MAG: hypothetical protein JSW56_08330, partial [Deltaproteobacteria bacterium]